jgi:hypothetical protein
MTGASFGTIGAEGLNPGRASDVTPETLLIFADTPNAFLARVPAAAGERIAAAPDNLIEVRRVLGSR